MPTPNEQELLNKSELPVQNPSKPPIAESSNVPGTELSPEEIDIPVGEVLPSEESTSQERKEVSLEGQAAVVKESLDSIKGGFVNWKQGILDSQLFSAEELPGVEQWFSDSLNRFKSIEQIIISELSVLQVLREGYSEQSKEIQKISERLLTVNKFVKEQQEKITSLLASLRLISEGLSQNPQAAKDNVVSSMKIVFKAMNDLSRKYLAGMDKQGLLRDLRESELLEKANNPEQFSTKLEEKKANLNLLYNCYNQASFSEIEKAFVFADVYFEKESMFLTAQENETLQSLLLANSDLEKTRIGKDGQLKPVIPDNLRQFYTLRAALEDSAEKYQILGANFSAMEFVDQILKDKKISALDNYDLQHYTLGAFQSQIGRLLSENKATEIPAYLQKNLNDLTNILSALLKLPVSDVSNYLKTNPAELRKIILEASGGVSGEVELTGAEDFPVPKTESVVLDDVMDADDLLEEVTTPDAKPKYSMPPLPAMETVKQAMSASEKTQLLENFWKAEDTFKQVVSRKVELGVSSDLKMIDNIKNTLIENGILEVGGVSLSSPEFTIDVNTLQTELWEGINNLIVSGLESKKEFSEIESEINKYISQKRAELVLLKEKLQKAITPFIEFRKQHPDLEQLMEANINSKLVAKVNAIASLVKNQFLKAGIEEVDGINLLALGEIYDGEAATIEFKNKVKSIIEEELDKGSAPDEVNAALNKFISQTDDKLRNLYKLLLENVPGRGVDRESQLVADFWKNQTALANRVSYYETMFAELQKLAQEKAGEPYLDDMVKNFRNNLNQSLKDALSQQKTEAEIVKWLEAEFKHADEIIDKLSVDVLLKKDKPQTVEEGGGDDAMNADDLLEEVNTPDAKPKYSMPPLPAMEAVKQAEQKSPEKRELSLKEMIASAKSFDELAEIIQKNQIVIQGSEKLYTTDQGSQKLYTTQDLLDSIAVAKDGKLAPNFWFAPRTHQFREKLISLSNAQRAKTSGEEMIELSDEDVEDITGKPVKATPPPLPPHIQKLQEEARKQKEMAEKAQVEAEPISLTEDMKKKPIDETKQTPDMATWLSEPIVGPHERMLGVSRLIKDLIKTGKYVDEKRLLIDIDNKFNRLAENLDNPETITAWEQFQAENNVEIEDPLVYFVDKVLDLNGIKAAYDSKNGFEFRNAVDIANLKVSNFMNALNLSEDYLPVPTRRSSVDARASLKRGGGIKVQMPGSL